MVNLIDETCLFFNKIKPFIITIMARPNKIFKAYAWCLTINNPRFVNDIRTLELIEKDPEAFGVAYMYAGRENYYHNPFSSAKPKTPHFQMVVCFGYPVSFKEVKTIFPRAHIEIMVKDLDSCIAYCSKEDKHGYKAGQLGFAKFLIERDGNVQISERGSKEHEGGKGVCKYYKTPDPSCSHPGSVDLDGTTIEPFMVPERYRYNPCDPMLSIDDWEYDQVCHPRYFD